MLHCHQSPFLKYCRCFSRLHLESHLHLHVVVPDPAYSIFNSGARPWSPIPIRSVEHRAILRGIRMYYHRCSGSAISRRATVLAKREGVKVGFSLSRSEPHFRRKARIWKIRPCKYQRMLQRIHICSYHSLLDSGPTSASYNLAPCSPI